MRQGTLDGHLRPRVAALPARQPVPSSVPTEGCPIAVVQRSKPPLKRFRCDAEGCCYATNDSGNLKRHKRVHTGERPFKCDFEGCGYAAAQHGDLLTHKRTHNGEKPYKCDFEGCGYTAAQRCHLTAHKRTHTGKKPFRCDFEGCSYAAITSGHLVTHKRTHTGEKPFKCDFEGCCYRASRSHHVVTHKRTHTGERPFKCDFKGCGYTATRNCHLVRHKRTHTGENPFKCDFEGCGYATAERGALVVHKRTHTGEKPYKCDFEGCNYAASTSGHLVTHKRTHTGEKPYKCEFVHCGYAAATSGSLKAHKRSLHTPEGQARRKKAEERVARVLSMAGYTEISAGRVMPPRMHYRREARIDFECLQDSAGAYASIDFIVCLANGAPVFLEVDEDQHRFGYGTAGCDGRRMARVHESLVLENQIPCGIRFLRYNPSTFKVGDTPTNPSRKEREAWLVEYLALCGGQSSDYATAPPQPQQTPSSLSIEYAYYNRSSSEDIRPTVCYDPDYSPTLCSLAKLLV